MSNIVDVKKLYPHLKGETLVQQIKYTLVLIENII